MLLSPALATAANILYDGKFYKVQIKSTPTVYTGNAIRSVLSAWRSSSDNQDYIRLLPPGFTFNLDTVRYVDRELRSMSLWAVSALSVTRILTSKPFSVSFVILYTENNSRKNWTTAEWSPSSSEQNWTTAEWSPSTSEQNWTTVEWSPSSSEQNWTTAGWSPSTSEQNWTTVEWSPSPSEQNWTTAEWCPSTSEQN
jgi:hypothetical protein